MDDSKCKCKEDIPRRRTMKLPGTKWEYPILKSKEYWEKFCDDEEKKLLVVRNPFSHFSYHPLSKNDSVLPNLNSRSIDNSFNPCLSNFTTDNSFENCSHRLSRDDGKLLPKPALKTPSRTKISDTTREPKVVRIPKLDTHGPQPSSARIFAGKVDRIRASFGAQNEPRAPSKVASTDFAALPILDKFPTSTLNKLRRHLRLPERRNLSEKRATTPGNRGNKTAKPESEEPEYTKSRVAEEDRKQPTDQVALKYSARFAYKALKRLTSDKKLDFEPKIMEQPLPEMSRGTSVNEVEEREPLKCEDVEERKQDSEKSLCFGDTRRKSIKDSEFTDADVEGASLKSEEATSKTILSESRCTSGPSLEFMYPESVESPSARVLASIPRLSGFPRKNRDRCLPCMFKPFETPLERKISLPRTALQRIISSGNVRIASSSDSDDSDSTLLGVRDSKNKAEGVANCEVDVAFDEQRNAVQRQVATEADPPVQEKYQEEKTEQKSIADSEISSKVKEDDVTSKNSNDVHAKASASFHDESSEDDSIVISISDEQAKPKYLVPCHAPTVFRPSLEPLRALRHRKPTTLQDRIAMLESSSLKKSISVDDQDDVQEKAKSSKVDEGRAAPPLTKAKSVLEKLTCEKEETPSRRKQLRKGCSFANFSTASRSVSDKSEITDTANDPLQQLKTVIDFSKADSKLPLTRSNEIVEALGNVEESSSTSMLEILCEEFSKRLSNSIGKGEPSAEKRSKAIATLTRLLAESKRYLYPDKFPSDLLFSTNQPICCNPRILRRVLPQRSYNLIAPLLGLPEWHSKRGTWFEERDTRHHIDRQRSIDETLSADDSLASVAVHPPTSRDTESAGDKKKLGQRRYNPYALFLRKPRRKIVTWRPLTEQDLEGYDPDATLKMRADNMMKKIFQDFCQWIENLGVTDKTIDEEVLKDMFEIDFDAEACKAMQVLIQEMPVVPTPVAITRNSPGASKLAMTRRHIMKDAKAERTPAKIKAFGTSIPWELRFVPPNNQVERKWLRCDNVPKDLETMDVVWKGITHLRSVRGFVDWLKEHPEVPQPEALKKIVSVDAMTLKQAEFEEAFAHLELDINQIKSFRVEHSVDASV